MRLASPDAPAAPIPFSAADRRKSAQTANKAPISRDPAGSRFISAARSANGGSTMYRYRAHWLAALAILACLIAGTSPDRASYPTQSAGPELTWSAIGDPAILTNAAPHLVAREASKSPVSAGRGSPVGKPEASPPFASAFRLLHRTKFVVGSISTYLDQSENNPRAPPRSAPYTA